MKKTLKHLFLYTSLINILGCSSNNDDSSPSKPPIANFDYQITNETLPVNVNFTNKSSDATTYLWDFGDGSTSTLNNPNHSFINDGVYTVTLAAKNSEKTNIFSQIITISSSLAEKVSGTFTGTGKYMPPNINLGDAYSCFVPNITSYLNAGNATCVISEIDSNTVNITLYGSLYTVSFSRNYTIVSSGNTITDTNANTFTYYLSSKQLNFLSSYTDWIYANSCSPENKYYYIFNLPVYINATSLNEHARSKEVYEFSGLKN